MNAITPPGRATLVAIGLGLALFGGGHAWADDCPKYAGGVAQGLVDVPGLEEASGLVESRRQSGVFWAHNDSGSPPRLYALDGNGAALTQFDLQGATNVDWEDMAIGPGPVESVDYLYVADIGDNGSTRSTVTIYRVPEPDVSGGGGVVPGVTALVFQYPDRPTDAETLMSDPVTGDLYIASKSFSDPTSRIYRYAFPQNETQTTTVELVAFHTFEGGPLAIATTGGDISPSGDQILIRTYTSAALWTRLPGETVAAALAHPPCEVPVVAEVQGEAIAFAADGFGYYTTSEQIVFGPQPLHRYARLDETSSCSLGMSLRHEGGTLHMDFELGTQGPATWGFWLYYEGSYAPVWSVDLPAIDPPITVPTFSTPFPALGELLFLSGLYGGTASCWNWDVVDTGR